MRVSNRLSRIILGGWLLVAALAPGAATHAAPPVSFDYGVACGDMSSTDAVLWTRTGEGTTLTPELLDDRGAVVRSLPPVSTSAESDFTVKTVANDLEPGSSVHYRFRGPSGELSPVGQCRTAPPADAVAEVTFGFSGDADWKWRPYPLVNALNAEPLDFFVFLGDTIYETTNAEGTASVEDLAGYRAKYRENRELPSVLSDGGEVPLVQMYQHFGMYAVPDNHEFGVSNADPDAPRYTEGGAPAPGFAFVNQTPGFKARAQAFSEYQPLRDRTVSATGDPRLDGTRGYYFSQPWGTAARLIVADDRSYRDVRLPNSDDPRADDPARTMLGGPQLAWVEQELAAAQAEGVTWKLIVISSPIQHIGRKSEVGADLDGSKSWEGGYRVERDRLLKFIADSAIDNVVFLTTDNHNTMINNLRYRQTPEDGSSPLVASRNAFEILTGPLGAGTGLPGLRLPSLPADQRTIDKAVVDMIAEAQKAGGVDPIGLEPTFPGLIASSVWSKGISQGDVQPVDFAAFNTYAYAVLHLTREQLDVEVRGIPAVDPRSLLEPDGMRAYLAEQPEPILRFSVQAQSRL